MANDRGAHVHIARRNWRVAFLIYFALLTLGTYWPQLQLDAPSPASDKMIHLLAFAGLTVLLWQTRWVRRRWLVVVLIGVWAVVNEWSQGLPALHRTSSWYDASANALGVLIVGVWLWALRPVGARVNRLRLSIYRTAFDRIFAHWRTWLVLLVILVLSVGFVISAVVLAPPDIAPILIVAAAMAAVFFACGYVMAQWPSHQRALENERPCFQCGRSADRATFDENGWGACLYCGTTLHADQWIEPPRPTVQQWIAAAGWPVAIGLVLFSGLALVMVLSSAAFRMGLQSNVHAELWSRASRMFGRLPRTLLEVIDVAMCLAILAVVVRLMRTRLARLYDQAERCRACGHDLTATPAPDGHGRCGECGTPFVRSTRKTDGSKPTSATDDSVSNR